jgi:hypothetical protein
MHTLTPREFCFSNLYEYLHNGPLCLAEIVSFFTLSNRFYIYGFT